MKKNPIIVPEKIHLLSIIVIKANLNFSEDLLDSDRKIENLQFGIAHESAYNAEEKRTRIRIFTTLSSNEGDSSIEAEYGVELHFEVDNFEEFTRKKGNEVEVDLNLAATLFGIAYSTVRGIVLERTQGTILGGIIIPVIDVIKVLNENDKS